MHYFNGMKFLFTFERERERERDSAIILKLKVLSFFYGYNCLENKDKPFLYRMYIKGLFIYLLFLL